MTSAINRYYDPTTDEFLSIDPDVAQTDQPYVFTNDDPLNAEDPLGLKGGPGTACFGRANANACDKREVNQINHPSGAIFQVCVDFAVINVCAAVDSHASTYVSYGAGIGIPGISASVTDTGKTKPSKVETGVSATIEGNFVLGGGVTFSPTAKEPLPLAEIGTPGAGFFVMRGVKFHLSWVT